MNWNDFLTLVMPYKDKLFRLALRIVGNKVEAEDIVQEVYIKLWNGKADLMEKNNLEAWCVRITKNLSLDKLKSKHRRTETITSGFDIVGFHATPDHLAEVNDQVNSVLEMMEKLPPKQKVAIQLRDIEGMTYKEVSEIMNTPINNVKILIFRARNFIKSNLIKAESYGL